MKDLAVTGILHCVQNDIICAILPSNLLITIPLVSYSIKYKFAVSPQSNSPLVNKPCFPGYIAIYVVYVVA